MSKLKQGNTVNTFYFCFTTIAISCLASLVTTYLQLLFRSSAWTQEVRWTLPFTVNPSLRLVYQNKLKNNTTLSLYNNMIHRQNTSFSVYFFWVAGLVWICKITYIVDSNYPTGLSLFLPEFDSYKFM